MTRLPNPFAGIQYVTVNEARREGHTAASLQVALDLLDREASENVREDHFHPEIAGPLQMAAEFLRRCLAR